MTILDIEESNRELVIAMFHTEAPKIFRDANIHEILATFPKEQAKWILTELREQAVALRALLDLLGPGIVGPAYAAIKRLDDGPTKREAIALWNKINQHVPGEYGGCLLQP